MNILAWLAADDELVLLLTDDALALLTAEELDSAMDDALLVEIDDALLFEDELLFEIDDALFDAAEDDPLSSVKLPLFFPTLSQPYNPATVNPRVVFRNPRRANVICGSLIVIV